MYLIKSIRRTNAELFIEEKKAHIFLFIYAVIDSGEKERHSQMFARVDVDAKKRKKTG